MVPSPKEMKNAQLRLPLLPLIGALLTSCIVRDVLSYGWQPCFSTTRNSDAVITRSSPLVTYRAMSDRACPIRYISRSPTTNLLISRKETSSLHMSSSSYYEEESDSSSYTNKAKRNQPKTPKKRSQLLQRLLSLMKRFSNNPLQSFWEQVTKKGYIFITRFKALPRKIQFVLAIQLFALSLLVGGASKQTYDYFVSKSGTTSVGSSRTIPLKREKPVEVYYSTFLDLVEKSGQGHTPGKNPAILLEDVQIGEDRISFQVKQDEAKHAVALQQLLQQRNSNKRQQSLVDNDDVSIKQIKTTKAFVKRIKDNENIIAKLRQSNIPFRAMEKPKQTVKSIVSSAGLIFYLFILLRIYRSMNMGGGSADTPGKWANAEQLSTVSFDEIQGMDMQKYEVMELVDSLRNPMKYSTIGARPPRGLLLVGPPGCGKTLLARAVATSAGVPLLYCSGSDFVEMFVGRGAARVRKTFARAAKLAPCIVFIDEIDALGKSRSFGGMNSNRGFNDEAEQTLNQLLACMDGLSSVKGVIVLAATNRKEVLDPALVRPGRFDRIVEVELPDAKGRERILRVHASKLKGFTEGKGVDDGRPGSLGKGYAVDLMAVASATPGLSGAELEFVVNEAAINAVRRLSSSMKEKKSGGNILSMPRILPTDFEASVNNFFKTRRPPSMKGLIENVFGTKG